jgi:hypothetical protein
MRPGIACAGVYRLAAARVHIRAVVGAPAGAIVVALSAADTRPNSREILASGEPFDLFDEQKRKRATPRGPPLGFREGHLYF